MIEVFQLLRSVGQYEHVDAGSQLPLAKLALIYAENARGKTTIAALLRSLGTGDATLITDRKRLGSTNEPHVVLRGPNAATAVFQNGAWTNRFVPVAVFDDDFVANNVCSGLEVESGHRQNLHELIIGARGVTLNAAVQRAVEAIESHNRALQTHAAAIPAAARFELSVDDFCGLAPRADVDQLIQETERALAGAKQAEAVRNRPEFLSIALPEFDRETIGRLLSRTLPDLEADAAAAVQRHVEHIGRGGERWIGDGIGRILEASLGQDHEVCPFCAQDLSGSPIIDSYRAYFSQAYEGLKRDVSESIAAAMAANGEGAMAGFERSVRVAAQTREFWAAFAEVPVFAPDTAEISSRWQAATNAVLAALRLKAASPLEALALSAEAIQQLDDYASARANFLTAMDGLLQANARVSAAKERAATADAGVLARDLNAFKATRSRHEAAIIPLCDRYLTEKAEKTRTEAERDAARVALTDYRQNVFPEYQIAINAYLQRFNANFRIQNIASVNNRAGSSCSYSVLINDVAVPLTAGDQGGPSFRTTMSSGDRNTLALAFFFAALDRDAAKARTVVVIDDPMTSLDEHRSLATIHEMQRIIPEVSQLIVLSHSKAFLCALWEEADQGAASAMKIVRAQQGSTLAKWDVRNDCITEHDRRHKLVSDYISNSVGIDERGVATSLRPILEAFARVAYPEVFPPGSLLGPFLGICEQREGAGNQIMPPADRVELRSLLDYANRFHHDTNPAWQTAVINDQELLGFCQRVRAFSRK